MPWPRPTVMLGAKARIASKGTLKIGSPYLKKACRLAASVFSRLPLRHNAAPFCEMHNCTPFDEAVAQAAGVTAARLAVPMRMCNAARFKSKNSQKIPKQGETNSR